MLPPDKQVPGLIFPTPGAAPVFDPKAQKTNLLTTLVREEMYQRTTTRPIPEFYAGSVMWVTYLDSKSKKRPKVMTGLCISRVNRGLGSRSV